MQGNRNKRVIWILDSGCSSHMTGDIALLSHFEEKAGPSVTFGNDNIGYTMGYGSVKSGNVIIEDVAFVEGLKHNLLSIGQFTNRGFKVEFDEDLCSISKRESGEVVLTGVKKGSLFVANLKAADKGEMCCFYTKATNEEFWLWHKKLSHLNVQAMNSLTKRAHQKHACFGVCARWSM